MTPSESPHSNAELGRSLIRALGNTGIAVLYQDRDLKIVWFQNVPPSWSVLNLEGKSDADFLPQPEASRMIQAKTDVLKSAISAGLELRLSEGDSARWFEVWIDADKSDGGLIAGVITTAVDITDQKRREQTLRVLLREVSHRSKNLLAIIQSIATQTGRYSDSIETFLTRFRGRIQSLASSQDLVTSSNWRGADLRELVSGQVARYATDPAHSVRFDGINPYLNPNAALHIGLALHELSVNSVSYGALSRPDGFVDISASIAMNGDASRSLTLIWREKISEEDDTMREKRFGSVALERVVPASLNGEARFKIENGMLEYRLLVPRDSFEVE